MAKNYKIQQNDRGMQRLLINAVRWSNGSMSVGVHPREGSRRYRSGITVAQVARFHANGTRRMIQRDPVGAWFTIERRRVLDNARGALSYAVRTGRSPLPRLRRQGARYVREIREHFALEAPLKPATIERKGSSKILVEHGLLWRAITFQVQLGKRTRR